MIVLLSRAEVTWPFPSPHRRKKTARGYTSVSCNYHSRQYLFWRVCFHGLDSRKRVWRRKRKRPSFGTMHRDWKKLECLRTWCTKIKWQIAVAAAAAAAAQFCGRGGKDFGSATTPNKKPRFLRKTRKTKKLPKHIENIDKKSIKKRRFWRSYEKTDVTIKFYAKNYPYRLIFKSVRLKIAKKYFSKSANDCTRSYMYARILSLYFCTCG